MKCRQLGLYLFVFLLTLSQFPLLAQVPYIKSFNKTSARAQETLSIQGINFGTTLTDIKVNFGGVSTQPQRISDQLIEVNVPFGARYEDINVINTSVGLMGYSNGPFLQSYGGTHPFNPSQVSTQNDFASQAGLYDLTTADFDGDGKMDVATSNSDAAHNLTSGISVFLNTGSPGTISFTKTVLTPGANTKHVASGDLDGDGKPEIIVTELDGPRIFIFKNNSTIGTLSFTMQPFTISGGKLSQVKIRDMDFNGKPDLVVSDQWAGIDRVFFVGNQSSLGSISFLAPVAISLGVKEVIDDLAVGDLDSDGLPEIVVCEFLSPTGNIFVLKNKSTPGVAAFASPVQIQTGTTIIGLRMGDLDGDTKPELAATGYYGSVVLIFGNQCTSSKIQFASPVQINSNQKPWGLDFGDMDGDGKTDIAVASSSNKLVTVLNNQSTAGSFAFQTFTIPTTYINRHIKIVDVDNDGKPDLNFASIDDYILTVPASKISVILNKNCVVPTITPNGPLTICSGSTPHLLLTASNNPGATYQWYLNGNPVSGGSTIDVNLNGTGSYSVALSNGSCSLTSTAVNMAVTPTASIPTVTPPPVSPVCIGGTLTLTIPTSAGATDYVWTGPGSYTANGTTVTRPGFQNADAGRYDVDVMIGTCITQRASVVVDAVTIPSLQVVFSGSDVLCQGQTKLFSIFPTVTGYNYQWAEQTSGDIAGAISSTYNANAGGTYFVKLKSTVNTSCPPISSASKTVRIAAIPFVDFTSPASTCVNLPTTFTDQTILNSDTVGLHVSYFWNFGDGKTSTTQNPTHTYIAASTFTVNLTVSYINNSCAASKPKSLPVKKAPSPKIINPDSLYSVCPLDSLLLQVVAGFDTYLWSTGEKTSSIYVKQTGSYSVDATFGVCKFSDDQTIGQLDAPAITASANPTSIKAGDFSKLTATTGLTNYLWRPNKSGLSDSTIDDPKATPEVSTTYTVSTKGANGCTGTATVDVLVLQKSTLDAIHPTNFFSPNGVDPNEVWVVENMESFPQCGVVIYDEKGIKVYESKPYLGDWRGISSGGKVLPAGVYYYVIKCDDSGSNYLAGSINIVR